MMVKQAEKIYSAFVDVTEEQTQLWLVIVFSCTHDVVWVLRVALVVSTINHPAKSKKGHSW